MSWYTQMLKQDAVYWANPTDDGYGGKTFDSPVELKVRWETKQQLFVDAQGQERRSTAVVFSSAELDLDGYLFLGTLDDLSSAEEDDPTQVDGAFLIRAREGMTGTRGGNLWVRKVFL